MTNQNTVRLSELSLRSLFVLESIAEGMPNQNILNKFAKCTPEEKVLVLRWLEENEYSTEWLKNSNL